MNVMFQNVNSKIYLNNSFTKFLVYLQLIDIFSIKSKIISYGFISVTSTKKPNLTAHNYYIFFRLKSTIACK